MIYNRATKQQQEESQTQLNSATEAAFRISDVSTAAGTSRGYPGYPEP